ncbi:MULTISPECIES: GGDEF domain-containing protein [Marinobacter]|uniref:diguanylate cyclase n=1 Tax=Marinobacter xestospongiae TaxID=994319 RepID=A0ABU3VT85_9GAMM|nr:MULTISPECIES: GGDEF domain-containing protein [Marinobacter]MCG8518976.1 GGDEF domain-containing protein [Pseudomonadales bacterium]MDV2077478.1 GGDEF domain-containing protein [Marinobacter xestospongiae]UDL04304.1 GGDEF domain-containing protein [Marinobacter sp. CA1]
MTETRLRTYTHLAGYGLTTLFIAVLAMQNLRYGFYPLFYLASGLALLTLAGIAYTVLARRQQLRAPGHGFILAALNGIVVAALFTLDHADISHWCLPLLVLNLLILPLRHGLILSLLTATLLTLFLLIHQSLSDAVLVGFAAIILISAGALYIWHYDHMAQSAEDLAITDPVTGAHNARFLDETLQKEISRSNFTGHPLSVIALGMDYLDQNRDLHGEAGLAVFYREVTQHLFGVIRAGDTLYTLGQGEFFLILPFTPEEGVRVIAERVRRSIAEREWPVVGSTTFSLGCTTRIDTDNLADALRKRACHALSEARRRGHDSIWYSVGEPPSA